MEPKFGGWGGQVINNMVLFIFQTFVVGLKLHALFTLPSAEDSVFVIINKEKPGIV